MDQRTKCDVKRDTRCAKHGSFLSSSTVAFSSTLRFACVSRHSLALFPAAGSEEAFKTHYTPPAQHKTSRQTKLGTTVVSEHSAKKTQIFP